MNKIITLQYLRAVAAILVVVHHAQLWIPSYADASHWLYSFHHIAIFGQIGVDLFFVISGFIMFLLLQHQFENSYSLSKIKQFWKRRFLRVAPLYWIYTLIIFVILNYQQWQNFISSEHLLHLFKSLLFLPTVTNAEPFKTPVLSAGWTLIIEMYFYTGICLAALFFKSYWMIFYILINILAVALFKSSYVSINWIVANLHLLEFCLGIMAAYLYHKRYLSTPLIFVLLLTGIFVMLYSVRVAPSLLLFALRALSSFLIVYSMAELNKNTQLKPINWLAFLGNASYTIYLSHAVFYTLVSYVFSSVSPVLNSYVLVFFLSSSAVLLGAFLYLSIEKPMLKFFKQKLI